MEGTPFGRYRLIELLGRGGMGEVWRAHDTATNNRTVAIKLLPPQLAADPTFVTRFRREADAAARLNNPHIIPIHTYGEIDGRLYVDMRLIEGRDLQEVLADGPLEPGRAVRIIEQVAKALHAAHQVGLLHRDIKPSNILLDHDDFAYLIDFGIARALDETRMTKSGNTIGTFTYIAPERLDSRAEEDARADIYSLACVLYESLTGEPPFAGTTTAHLIAAHLNTPPPRPSATQPEVPAAVDEVIATGMAKDPDQRYATTVELANAARDAITAPIERPTPRPTRLPATEPAPGPTLLDDPTRPATQQRPPSRPPVPRPRPAHRPPPDTRTPAPAGRKPPASSAVLRPMTAIIAVLTVILIGIAALVWHPWQPHQSSKTTSATPIASAPSSPQQTMIAPPPTSATTRSIAGMTVFLDPGRSGANDASIYRQVPNGRGGTTNCQAIGGSTDDNYPEHAFTWDIVGRIQNALNQLGVRTQLSRDNDNSAGPCVDQRAALANAMRPDAIVSIHADAGPPSGRGFYVSYSSPALNDAQAGPALQLAHTMRDALVAAGYQPSTYIGSDGLYGRDDLAGLNLAQYPAILVDPGNMKNSEDAAKMESADGRAKYAAAITQGIVAYLSA